MDLINLPMVSLLIRNLILQTVISGDACGFHLLFSFLSFSYDPASKDERLIRERSRCMAPTR